MGQRRISTREAVWAEEYFETLRIPSKRLPALKCGRFPPVWTQDMRELRGCIENPAMAEKAAMKQKP